MTLSETIIRYGIAISLAAIIAAIGFMAQLEFFAGWFGCLVWLVVTKQLAA